jgi:hypothetical protein
MANERFWLLLSWVEAQSEESEEGKQEFFTRMAKQLYFHAMAAAEAAAVEPDNESRKVVGLAEGLPWMVEAL